MLRFSGLFSPKFLIIGTVAAAAEAPTSPKTHQQSRKLGASKAHRSMPKGTMKLNGDAIVLRSRRPPTPESLAPWQGTMTGPGTKGRQRVNTIKFSAKAFRRAQPSCFNAMIGPGPTGTPLALSETKSTLTKDWKELNLHLQSRRRWVEKKETASHS